MPNLTWLEGYTFGFCGKPNEMSKVEGEEFGSNRGGGFRRLFEVLVAPTRQGHLWELGSSLGSPKK